MELYIEHVSKRYKSKLALDDLDIILKPGIHGLLGANGAGKTTIMRILCALLEPSKGKVLLDGENIIDMGERFREKLGYLPQHFGYYPDFTAIEFLMYIAALKGLSKSNTKEKSLELLKMVNLIEEKNKKLKGFSGGMLQRVGIAQALLNSPEIIVLDEPSAGLDPQERVRLRNILSKLSRDKIILISTHILSDIESIANNIIIMKNGKVMMHGDGNDLVQNMKGKVWECVIDSDKFDLIKSKFKINSFKTIGNSYIVKIISAEKPMENAALVESSLEDLYLQEFGEEEMI